MKRFPLTLTLSPGGYGIHTVSSIAKRLEQKEICVIPAFAGMTADKFALFQCLT
jgi:hypothetical protein